MGRPDDTRRGRSGDADTGDGMKRVLMVAYHFPPLAGSSGIQRTLRFVQHLPRHDWQPLVLTADTRAYERTSTDLDAEIPADTVVRRAFALDTARHLSLGGRHLAAMARPDRWVSWKFAGVREGMRMIREFAPDALWSTYPIATAHLIAGELHRRSGLPWIADFRDPMAQDGYPADPVTWQQFSAIERHAVEHAHCSLFTTPSAARTYRERYPSACTRIGVLENGYDEDSFAAVERDLHDRPPLNEGSFTLLHSGIVYPQERDPTQLFAALRRLRDRSPDVAARLKIRFRAPVHTDLLHGLASHHQVEDMVQVAEPVGYQDALREMLCADALLVLQAANCNEQIPAKVYEYLRARRPIIALTDSAGDTASMLRDAGVRVMAPLNDAEAIAGLLDGAATGLIVELQPMEEAAAAASRSERARDLALRLRDATAAAQRAPPSGRPYATRTPH